MKPESLELSKEQKHIYIRCLNYVLSLSKNECAKKESRKKAFMTEHTEELGIPFEEYKNIKITKKPEEIIKNLKTIPNIKIKKYILREMILLAIADHELTDCEISAIYQIGSHSGIKEEKISDFFLWAAKGVEWQIEGMRLLEEDI